LLADEALSARPRPSPLVMRKMYWHSPHALQVIADTEHGFLFWTPLAVLAIAGLILMTVAPDRATASTADASARADAARASARRSIRAHRRPAHRCVHAAHDRAPGLRQRSGRIVDGRGSLR